ncbi:hypothetical protein, partial [Paracoccus simplex]
DHIAADGAHRPEAPAAFPIANHPQFHSAGVSASASAAAVDQIESEELIVLDQLCAQRDLGLPRTWRMYRGNPVDLSLVLRDQINDCMTIEPVVQEPAHMGFNRHFRLNGQYVS